MEGTAEKPPLSYKRDEHHPQIKGNFHSGWVASVENGKTFLSLSLFPGPHACVVDSWGYGPVPAPWILSSSSWLSVSHIFTHHNLSEGVGDNATDGHRRMNATSWLLPSAQRKWSLVHVEPMLSVWGRGVSVAEPVLYSAVKMGFLT